MTAVRVAVLLIEDNPGDRGLISQMLAEVSGVDFQLCFTESLADGLGELNGSRFDVALVDLSLPDADGLEACLQVRARAPKIPIVVLTGLDDSEIAIEALQQGAQDYLVKGQIDSNLLSRSLRYAIERNKAEVALEAARCGLEARVEQRTAELKAANLRLQQEMAERRVAEENERKHREQLAHIARLNMLGEMASTLAHEMNQPLTAIVGYSSCCLQRVRSGQWDADELVGLLEKAAVEAKRGGAIIKRLRNLVRRRASERLAFNLNEAVRDVVTMVQPEATAKRIVLNSDLDQRDLWIVADRVEIEQVLLNLIRNGLDACNGADCRQVGIETLMGPERTIEVAVTDSGWGGDIQNLDRLFEPFYSTKPEGLGLGLAISRAIVETHGGTLEASPNSGAGLTFRFELPAADTPESVAASSKQSSGDEAPEGFLS
jgi:C4-dicarboxylate-specific signal transduction histidine kinase